jgi:peptidoglycan/xylan/chitin deacetylase (PgdA/CDA1 family)
VLQTPELLAQDDSGDSSANVIGAYEVDILACPRPTCAVLGQIPLDASVIVTGIPVDDFVPVRYRSSVGFVQRAFLNEPTLGVAAPEFTEGAAGCDRVALIFNIGSGYQPATAILDTLAAEDVPATMFLMGWWAEQNPDLVRRMVADGQPLGSHGNLPPELTARSDDDVATDLRAAAAAIERAAGKPPGPWFTPFAAAIDDRVRAIAADQGYLSVGWTVRSEDWNPAATADEVYQRVVSAVHDGAIVELHLDASTSVDSTAVALPWIIRDLRAAGYRFVTIPEMVRPCRSAVPAASPVPPPRAASPTPAATPTGR